jgi:hypothetical protein
VTATYVQGSMLRGASVPLGVLISRRFLFRLEALLLLPRRHPARPVASRHSRCEETGFPTKRTAPCRRFDASSSSV